ncbi:MAG TPA: OB-fold nucleic acid binding domain-containing protein, partial [Tepidisphaeraceae bacterium]|nr:OB-fold nucleic acid binding domain-containing protein [Tepidisphaeraceae bacterium]
MTRRRHRRYEDRLPKKLPWRRCASIIKTCDRTAGDGCFRRKTSLGYDRDMQIVSIHQALTGQPGEGAGVIVRGWVRTRRDSKGGFSFVAVNDGSCFDNIQCVADNKLENYSTEVAKLTAGCAVEIGGKLVKSQGKGQAFE